MAGGAGSPCRPGAALRISPAAETSRIHYAAGCRSSHDAAQTQPHDPLTMTANSYDYGWIKLLRMAKRIKSLKLSNSILRMMWLRWLSTVRVETPIDAAASLLLFPLAKSCTTSSSRCESDASSGTPLGLVPRVSRTKLSAMLGASLPVKNG